MTRFLLSLILMLSSTRARADELDGQDVVRVGLRGLAQNQRGSNSSASLGGYGALVGFGLWSRVFENWRDGEGGVGHGPDDVREFIRDGEDLIERGLTLAQLVRRAYPNVTGELTPDRIVKMALRPYANQLSDLRTQLERWLGETTWVNLGDTCAPDLDGQTAGP